MIHVRNKNLLLSILPLLFAACHPQPAPIDAEASDAYEDMAMAHYTSQPERALSLLDSAETHHLIEHGRVQYLKAVVLYDGLDRPDSSIALCQQLIDEQAWQTLNDAEMEASYQVDLYRLMATAATSTGNKLAVMRYAAQGVKLAHGVEMLKGDEADLLSRMGYMMCQTGQVEEGLKAMRDVEQQVTTDDSWSALLAYFNNAKKLYHSLLSCQRYNEALVVVEAALGKLEQVTQHPEAVRGIPNAMLTEKEALDEFVSYYRIPFYAYQTNLCCELGQREEAELWLDRFRTVADTSMHNLTQSIIPALITLEHYDEAHDYLNAAKRYAMHEEVSEGNLQLLKEELRLAKAIGTPTEVAAIGEQIIDITDSLNRSNYQILLADAASQYQLQEAKLMREDSEAKLKIWIMVSIIVVFMLITLLSGICIRRLQQNRRRLHVELEETKDRLDALTTQGEDKAKPSSVSLEEIYNRALYVMEHYNQFSKGDFDINMLAEQVFSNRTYVSAAINQMSGMNFRSWLAQYRIEHAKRLLANDPKISIEDLLMQCGYDNRTNYYRQFKSVTGMTPNEWIASLEEPEAQRDGK